MLLTSLTKFTRLGLQSANSNDVRFEFSSLLTHLSRRLISKVRNVLEAQLPRVNPELKAPRGTSSGAETITLRTDHRQFDVFLRSIDHMSSLLDARRLKNDIMGEIRRTRALLGMTTDRATRCHFNHSFRS